MEKKLTLRYLSQNLGIAVGLVLIWRGIWHLLDAVDMYLLNGDKIFTSIGGIILGVLVLYLPDKDLKELQKL